jgi:uncharacterized protein YxjI
VLHLKQYFIREHVGLLKLVDTYDIIDPATKAKIGEAREEIGGLLKLLRLLGNLKQLLPTTVNVYQGEQRESQQLVFSIHRGYSFLRSKVKVRDSAGQDVGYFLSKVFSLGGAFRIFTPDEKEVALVKGDWKGWNFRFLSGTTELGLITKKWAGLGKELFTSADNYMIDIHGEPNPTVNTLLLAAGLAIDTVYKEGRG